MVSPASIKQIATVIIIAAALSSCIVGRGLPPETTRAPAPDPAAVARGEYLVTAANCVGCHTDKKHGGARFAGGGAVPTPFGIYYSRNITPDRKYGIGRWSDENFLDALRDGVSPQGAHYFPAFPFTAFTNMTDRDILDIKAYLFVQPPAAQKNKPHDVGFPFDVRMTMVFWRALYFHKGPLLPDPRKDAAWNRGNYLVNAVAHCGECHTPRDWLGGLEQDKRFAGARLAGPNGFTAPNITPTARMGIGAWTTGDIADLLKTGSMPNGDTVDPPMSEVVTGTSKLTDADRMAIAEYLKSVPPKPTAIVRKPRASSNN